MTTVLFTIGAAVAAVLLGLLVLTLLFRPLRIWPTPGSGSWQGYVFWPLFRSLNVLCFAVALADRSNFLGLPAWLRLLAFVLLAGSIALFIYSFRVLGRDNSYGAQDGLVTRRDLSLDPQSAERDAHRCLRLPCVCRRQRAGLCAVRGHDGRLRPDGAGRGAVARGGLRRALPALLQPRAPLLQLATGGSPGARRRPAAAAPVRGRCLPGMAAARHFPSISRTSGQ